MASTRLRKTFKYPTDDSSEPDELDEEHQEQLIESLQAEDARKNELYRAAFLSIPLSGAVFFFYRMFKASSAQQTSLATLSLTSLICTAYILYFMPILAPKKKGKTAVYRFEAAQGPVEKYLVYLNVALAGFLLLAGVISWRKRANEDAWREALPALLMAITMFARQQLAPLNLEELERAMYDFKGA